MAELVINKERLVNTFLELAQINAKSGDEKPVADYIKNYLSGLKINVMEDDAGSKIGANSGNLFCRLPGTVMTTPGVVILSHMDTVIPCDGVKPVIRDEIIYAESPTILGADDRAGVAVMLELANILHENRIPHGEVELVFTVSEEIGLAGVRQFDMNALHSKMALVLDGHGSPGIITTAAPTLRKLKIRCHGKSAHAGVCPESGINVIEMISHALSQMKLGRIDHETTANFGIISGGKATNIVPDSLELIGEVRSIDPVKLDKQIEHMQTIFHETAKKFGGTIEMEVQEEFQGYQIPDDHLLLDYVKTAATRLQFPVELRNSGGGTDANILNAGGLFAIVLSVGYKDMHSPLEHIAIKDLINTVRWLIEILWVVNQQAWNQFQTQPLSSVES